MTPEPSPSDQGSQLYDAIAWFYDRYWERDLYEQLAPALEKLFLAGLPAGARVLDVCCGSGTITAALAARGYRVTGLDGSREMLERARRNVPAAEFFQADARAFRLAPVFDGALSTFDSLNHILDPAGLGRALENVQAALRPGGVFLFDLNLEEAYLTEWSKSGFVVDDDCVCLIRGDYDRGQAIGRSEWTIFRRNGGLAPGAEGWRRTDQTISERCYPPDMVRAALGRAGFGDIESFAAADLGVTGRLAVGRAFFRARRRAADRTARRVNDRTPRRVDAPSS